MRALDQLQLEGHEDLKRELLMKILSRDDGDWELKVRKHGVDVGHTQPTHPGLCWTTWLRGVTWWGGTPALHEQGSVMMLINGVLNCEQLEESVTLRADFMFLSMMDVIRVCTAVANSTVCPRHRARFPTAAAWLGWGWVGFGVGVWRVLCSGKNEHAWHVRCGCVFTTQSTNDKLMQRSRAITPPPAATAGPGKVAAPSDDVDHGSVLNKEFQFFTIRAHEDEDAALEDELQLSYVRMMFLLPSLRLVVSSLRCPCVCVVRVHPLCGPLCLAPPLASFAVPTCGCLLVVHSTLCFLPCCQGPTGCL